MFRDLYDMTNRGKRKADQEFKGRMKRKPTYVEGFVRQMHQRGGNPFSHRRLFTGKSDPECSGGLKSVFGFTLTSFCWFKPYDQITKLVRNRCKKKKKKSDADSGDD